jgi:hypothetical protein
LHLDILFKLNTLAGLVNADTLKGVLTQWYDTLKK